MGIFLKHDNWYIDYYANGRRKREMVGSSRKLAETVLQKRKVEIAEGRFLDIKKQQEIKFEDFADQYLELHSKVNNRSWKRSDLYNINVLKTTFSGRNLYEITPFMVEEFKQKRAKEVSPATVNRNLACLRSMFNKAIEWGKVEKNPTKNVKLFKENNKRTRFLEKEEIAKLLSNCDGYLKAIIIVALNTGMRRSEILGLKWRDIDFNRNIIYLYNTKNNERREIPLNEQVKTTLIRVRKHPDSEYIFHDSYGKPFKDVKKSWLTAVKKANIMNFRLHDLRHTFASHLVMSGVDLNTVRELLGHKSLAMTLRYCHLASDHKKKAIDILGQRLAPRWTPEEIIEEEQRELVSATL